MNKQAVLCVSLVVLFNTLRVNCGCCHFNHLNNCTVFQKDGKSVCSRRIIPQKDVASISELSNSGNDIILESNVIELQDVEFSMWFQDMCRPSISEGCPENYPYFLDRFLFLNVSFSLRWQNVTRVIFEITDLSENEELQQKTYHIIDVENPSGADTIIDKEDYYYIPINFLSKLDVDAVLTMLPSVSYMISVYLPDQNHNVVVDTINVTAPDCFKLIEEEVKNIHFCDTLKSPAYWLSEVFVKSENADDTANVTFKVDTEREKCSNYTVALHDSVNHNILQLVTLDNNKVDQQYSEELGYSIMSHVYHGIPTGTYFVTVQANVNSSICKDEPYWGHKPCRIANSRNFSIASTPGESSTQVSSINVFSQHGVTSVTPSYSNPTTNQVSTGPYVPEELQVIVKLVVALFVIIICSLFFIVAVKYLRKIWECLFRVGEPPEWKTIDSANSMIDLRQTPLRHPGEQLMQKDNGWLSETDTFASDPTTSEVRSLGDTTVTDGCEHGEFRHRPLWEQPLISQLDTLSMNFKPPDEIEVSNFDQNSNDIRNGVIHGQEPADYS